MDVSRGALRRRLLAMRAWDSQGKSLDDKINEAIDQALDRMATDIPEALLPDEEHVALRAPVKSGDDGVDAYVRVCAFDKRLLEFVDSAGTPIDNLASDTTWRPNCSGEWDGIMHIEVKGPSGRWHRRQCREFFYYAFELQQEPAGKVIPQDGITTSVPGEAGGGITLDKNSIEKIQDEEDKKSGMNLQDAARFSRRSSQPLGTPINVTVEATSLVAESKQYLASRLGLAPNDISDEVLTNYLKQRKNPKQRFQAQRQGHSVVVPEVMVTDNVGAGQSADALNGVAAGQGLVNKKLTGRVDAGTPLTPFASSTGVVVGAVEGEVVGSGGSTGTSGYRLVTLSPDANGFSMKVIRLMSYKAYMVTIDRPWRNNTDGWLSGGEVSGSSSTEGLIAAVATDPMEFRIHQPEFFTRDDVMELNEPAVIWDGSRQQVWSIDTAGADRADMRDYQGESAGRPVRMYRGRHFQLPAPTVAPMLDWQSGLYWDLNPIAPTVHRGSFRICYTYVWGRRDLEWQQAPNVAPLGHEEYNPNQKLWWAHDAGLSTLMSETMTGITGVSDPVWESAPSPVGQIIADDPTSVDALIVRATNIDAMLGFSNPWTVRFGHTGLRLRFYIAYTGYDQASAGTMDQAETSEDQFYLLCEAEPTFDQLVGWFGSACRFVINGSQFWDIERPLRHSTGYFAWKTYPAHDQRYELDLRVTRLPRRLADDQDTPPIQRGAVSALVELAAHYGKVVEPKSLGGVGRGRHNRFGTFDS